MIKEEHKEGNLAYDISIDTTDFNSWTDTRAVEVTLNLKVNGNERTFRGRIEENA